MKKFLVLFIVLFLTCGCSIGGNTAKSAVEDYLNGYKNLSLEVLTDLEEVIENESLNEEQKEVYRDIMKKQYSDLKYEIVQESFDGDTALISVKISVYDLYKAQKESAEYLKENINRFNDDNGSYDNSKYLDYKLNRMKNETERVEYIIDYTVEKDDNMWRLNEITSSDLEKIHGIYNYEEQ